MQTHCYITNLINIIINIINIIINIILVILNSLTFAGMSERFKSILLGQTKIKIYLE